LELISETPAQDIKDFFRHAERARRAS
jgi:hypothetical protein